MKLDKSIAQLKGAVSGAFTSMQKLSGVQTDPELKRYVALTPDDFGYIASRFGMDETATYIEAMENRLHRKVVSK